MSTRRPRQPHQPAEHVSDVRAKGATVHVSLVDHHEPKLAEHALPKVGPLQDAEVQGLRVRKDEMCVSSGPPGVSGHLSRHQTDAWLRRRRQMRYELLEGLLLNVGERVQLGRDRARGRLVRVAVDRGSRC